MELGEIFGSIFFEPLQEWSGIVQSDVNLRMLGEKFYEGKVGFFVAGSEDAAEIAARLVRVDK